MYYKLDWSTGINDTDYTNTASSPSLGVPWSMGIYYPKEVPEPIICELNPDRGDKLRDVFLIDIPIFSDKFVAVLEEAGVDNFQLYQAELHAANGQAFKNYKAVNINGLVSCANLDDSEFVAGSKPPLMGFSKLVIDEQRANNLDFFRLAEDSLHILVSEKLKQKIEAAGLVGFQLIAVESSG